MELGKYTEIQSSSELTSIKIQLQISSMLRDTEEFSDTTERYAARKIRETSGTFREFAIE
jgi:hypothetical protein